MPLATGLLASNGTIRSLNGSDERLRSEDSGKMPNQGLFPVFVMFRHDQRTLNIFNLVLDVTRKPGRLK